MYGSKLDTRQIGFIFVGDIHIIIHPCNRCSPRGFVCEIGNPPKNPTFYHHLPYELAIFGSHFEDRTSQVLPTTGGGLDGRPRGNPGGVEQSADGAAEGSTAAPGALGGDFLDDN